MNLTSNPTKTKTIEANYFRDIRRRFAALNRNIVSRLQSPAGGLALNAMEMSIEQQRIFMAWLEQEIERLFFNDDWQSQYQLQSYERALERVRSDLLRAGEDLALTERELELARQSDFNFTAISSLATPGAELQPIHQDALQFLFARSYEDLRTATAKMSTAIRQALFDGVQQGLGIAEVTREIKRQTGITERNAQRIARTETIQAYQRSTINESERVSELTGESYKLVWITARDERVRRLHAGWHGTIASATRTREKIEESPWNCRCAQRIVTQRMLTEARVSKWERERLAVMLLAS